MSAFPDRLLPARPDLAADFLRGRVNADAFAAGQRCRVTAPVLDLTMTPEPGATRATQLLHGETFVVYEERKDGLAWGQAALDGYVGYVDARHLGPAAGTGRRVTALWSHVYDRPLVQGLLLIELPYLAEVPISGTSGAFAKLRSGGFVPAPHIAPVGKDFVAEAERFIGVPYLWGGRSARGIDCSGLLQLALLATGRKSPRDTDMQLAMLGREADGRTVPSRGDLVFWKGHVGIMRDADTLLHANAYHMAVASEPLATAASRIAAAGGGPITGRRRLEG